MPVLATGGFFIMAVLLFFCYKGFYGRKNTVLPLRVGSNDAARAARGENVQEPQDQ